MALIKENQKRYQIVAMATNQSLTYYSVKEENSDDVEMLTLKELKLLHKLTLPLFDNDMKPISFTGDILNGNIPDVTNLLFAEDVEEDEEGVDDFFGAYDDEDSDEDYSNEEEDSEDDYDYGDLDDEVEGYEEEDDGYDDFFDSYGDEEDDPEESTVSKLYTFLNQEQITVLKRYYLWFSQRLFADAQKDPTLGMKDKNRIAQKKADLDQLRKTGDLWHYAGFIDMGYRGAGFCTLGHPLRYKHLAWDVSYSDIESTFFGEDWDADFEDVINSNNCIAFGIKCIGDFFEVDAECVRSLQRAQRESLKDMATLYDFYAEGITDTVNDSFSILDEIVNKVKVIDAKGKLIKKDYNPIIPFGLSAFYLQFRNVKLIPPKSLIQEIRDSIVGWKSHKFTGNLRYPDMEVFRSNVNAILGNKYTELINSIGSGDMKTALFNFEDKLGPYLYTYFTYEICGWYKYNANTSKDEGGTSRPVREALATCYASGFNNIEGVDYSLNSLICCIEVTKCLKDLNKSKYEYKYIKTYNSSNSSYKVTPIGLVDVLSDYVISYRYGRRDDELSTLLEEYDSINNTQLKDAVNFLNDIRSSRQRNRTLINPKVFTDSEERILTFSEFHDIIIKAFNCFSSEIDKFIEWTNVKAEEDARVIKDKIKEEERLQREEKARLEEERRLKIEEAQKNTNNTTSSTVSASNVKTDADLVKFLASADLSSLNSDYDFPKQILATVSKSNSAPSSKQMYYLKKLYKGVTGVEFVANTTNTSDKVLLADRKDLQDAIKYVLDNESKIVSLEKKTIDICKSIPRYGTISERQMKYAEEALDLFNKKGV